MLSKLARWYEAAITARPKLTLVVIALVLLGLLAGLPRFKLDASADSLTLEHDRSIDYFREISTRYQSGDFLVITFTPHEPLFSDQALATLRSLRDELAQVEGVVSVNSMLDVPLLYSPLLTLAEITDEPRTLMDEDVDREQAKQEFLESPIYKEMILGPEGQTTAILLNLEVDSKYMELVRHRDALRLKRSREGLSPEEEEELERVSEEFTAYRTEREAIGHERVETVRGIVEKYRDRAEIFLGGVSMITADMISFIKSDLVVFGTGILIFMIVTLFVIFREIRFVVIPILTCITAVAMMLGLLSWLDWRLTVISNNFVTLLLIISLAITIHLIVRYREFHAENPDWSQQQLVMATVKIMALPILYTALTTMVAFASLVVSDIKPVIDFGWMMTLGLGVALLLSFVLLPACLMVLPKGEAKDKGDKSGALTLRFSRFAEKHARVVYGVAIIAAAVSVYGMSRLEVENRFIDYFHESTEIYQGMSVIDQRLGGTTTLDIILDMPQEDAGAENVAMEDDPFADPVDGNLGEEEVDPFADPASDLAEGDDGDDPFGGFDDPFADDDTAQSSNQEPNYWFTVAGLNQIEALHDYLETLPEVGKVQSLATAYKVAKDINRGQLNDFELAILESNLPAEIRELIIRPYLSREANQTRITLRAKETDPNLKRAELIGKIHNYAVEEIGFEPDQVHFTGLLVLYNNMLESLFRSQILTMGAVFVGITFMFLVLFRSFVVAMIAIAPCLLAAGVVLGTMGIAGIPLDMMTITIAAITVGIGVDHAIHYLYRFRSEVRLDGDYIAAMHRSHQSIGRAMYYTAVTIIVGFSVLALSKFIPSIYFGLLTGLAMFAAILGSLTLLPRLIVLTKPFGKGPSGQNP